MEKLELKHLAPYLPYDLKGVANFLPDTWFIVKNLKESFVKGITMPGNNVPVGCAMNDFKPILRPLTDIYNLIKVDGDLFTPHEKYDELFGPNDDYLFEVMNKEDGICIEDIPNLPYYVVEWLMSLHFDVFGLIEKGLAIDINTLKS